MFGNLANSAQRKASGNKPKANKAASGNGDLSSVFGFLSLSDSMNANRSGESLLTADEFPEITKGVSTGAVQFTEVSKKGEREILYVENGEKELERDTLYSFFVTCGTMLLDPKIIDHICVQSEINKSPLHVQAMEFQKDVLEYNFQIERNYGCKELGMVGMKFKEDEGMKAAATDFMKIAMKSFIQQLKRRAAKRIIERGSKLRASGGLSRVEKMEFFEGCNAVMSLKQTKDVLRENYLKHKDMNKLGGVTIDLQHSILELVGVTKEHGVESLNRMMVDHKGDQEIGQKFASFRSCAEISTHLSTLDEKETEEFLAEVPDYMRDYPHVYFMRKQQEEQYQQQQQQQEYSKRVAEGNTNPEVQEHQQKLLDFLNSQDGQDKVHTLNERMKVLRESVMDEAETMDASSRASYFEEFSKEPFIETVKQCGGDMVSRIGTFVDMDEANMKKALKMQLLFTADARAGGALLAKLRTDAAAASGVGGVMQSIGAMTRMAMIEKGMELKMSDMAPGGARPGAGGHDHGHGHSQEGHVHGPNCNHGPPKAAAVDVTRGSAESMDR